MKVIETTFREVNNRNTPERLRMRRAQRIEANLNGICKVSALIGLGAAIALIIVGC